MSSTILVPACLLIGATFGAVVAAWCRRGAIDDLLAERDDFRDLAREQERTLNQARDLTGQQQELIRQMFGPASSEGRALLEAASAKAKAEVAQLREMFDTPYDQDAPTT